ncbi:MAG: hypothetical protein JWL83_558 [Actinomycetia bacterium]|jgi:hypothetical protein|nr:hypothetical protein [Actinomycetes bacterium]
MRSGSSTAPIVVGERIVTLRSRTTSVPFQFGEVTAVVARARPHHVEVLEPDGRHLTIRVRDVTFGARLAVTIASATAVIAARVCRRAAAKQRARSNV